MSEIKLKTINKGDFIQDKITKNIGVVKHIGKNITAKMPTVELTQGIEHWETPELQ